MIPLWDSWVRLFHWSLAATVLFLLYSGETGTGFFNWHRPVGEVVLALIVFRLMWGLWGSSPARLLPLFKSPIKALNHLLALVRRNSHQDRGHNAAGGWAVIIMLLIIGVQAGTGLFIADEDEFVEGVFYGELGSTTTNFLYSVHHFNAHVIQVFVVIHIVMIALYAIVAGQNLLMPMISGRMRWRESEAPPVITMQPFWLGLLTAAGAALLYFWLFGI